MGIPYAEVIGDPVEHSKSPVIHKFWLEKLGIEAEYRATRVAPAELRDYLASRRADPDWLGCNVTMPHKVRVWQLLPHVTSSVPPERSIASSVAPPDSRVIISTWTL